jgi:hypothetical protein
LRALPDRTDAVLGAQFGHRTRIVDEHLVLAMLLRPVGSALGKRHERIGLGAVDRVARDADGRRRRHGIGSGDAAQLLLYAQRYLERPGRVRVRQYHRELVCADPAHDIAAARCVPTRRPHGTEHLVAGGMTVTPVERVEIVQVDGHDRQRLSVADSHIEVRRKVFVKVPVVEEPRHGIGHGTMEQLTVLDGGRDGPRDHEQAHQRRGDEEDHVIERADGCEDGEPDEDR